MRCLPVGDPGHVEEAPLLAVAITRSSMLVNRPGSVDVNSDGAGACYFEHLGMGYCTTQA